MKRGFTLIEVLVAMLIFTMAVVVSVDLVRGTVRSTARTRSITEATWLLQNIMTELETRIETLGFQEGCEKEAEAAFEEPFENFSWKSYCTEIDFHLSASLAQMQQEQETGEEAEGLSENSMMKRVLEVVNTHLGEAARELHAEVRWFEGDTERVITLTTHVVDFSRPLKIPGL